MGVGLPLTCSPRGGSTGRLAAELGATLLCCVSAPNCGQTLSGSLGYGTLTHCAGLAPRAAACPRAVLTRPMLPRSNRLKGLLTTGSLWMRLRSTSGAVVWM